MLESLNILDTHLLLMARSLTPSEYAPLLQILGESVVLWGVLLLIGLWIYGIKREDNRYKMDALMIGCTIVLTFVFYIGVNLFVEPFRPNPQELLGGIGALIPHPTDNSFPSGHALFTGALIAGLVKWRPKMSLIMTSIVFGILTTGARVFGGIHYPGDILGGLIPGYIGGWLWTYVVETRIFREYIFAFFIRLAKFFRL